MMRRYWTWVGPVVFTFALLGCGSEEETINRVGVNVVEKALFEDSWYMARTVIDVDYEGSALGTFPGDTASDQAQTFTAIPRIRWIIDEDLLVAYRDYKLTEGGDGDSKGPPKAAEGDDKQAVMGQPVAAFKVEKHFDIQREYNPSTGEQQNVVVENDTDRRWFERQYMRVDWSKNLLPGYYGQTYNLYELLGNFKREAADLVVQSASAFPDSWQPRFDRMKCDTSEDKSEACTPEERDFADDYPKDELYHMSFVTQEVLSPDAVDDPVNAGRKVNWCTEKLYSDAPPCTSVASYVRTSFLRVSKSRQYEPVNWVDSRFERFGYFRLSQDTVDRSTGKPDDPAFGRTDFLNYNINRHNIWKSWFDQDGNPLPYDQRDVRQIVWYTTPELPAHLMQPALDVVGQWNGIMMETVRELQARPQPTYPEVSCQSDDPDGYCFCQPDPVEPDKVVNATCPGRYDPFTRPSDAADAGAVDPYDCYVEVPADAEPPARKPGLTDADFNNWFEAKFSGTECVTVLRANACNKLTETARAAAQADGKEAPALVCEERGDLRFKFLSYVEQPGTGFLGIATLRGDPETGEIITGDANIGGPALDGYRTSALQTYDLINGTLSEADITSGEDVRGYFQSLGRIDQPARPRLGFNVQSQNGTTIESTQTRAEIDNRMQTAMKRLERLKGPEGRQNTFSDRRQKLIGTDLERRLVAGSEMLSAAGYDPQTPLTDQVLDRVSPFRSDLGSQMNQVRQAQTRLSRANVHMPTEYIDNSVQWFVNKHADWTRPELEFALNRLLYRQTELHELGHCLGLRHDFGGSADSAHYAPEYYAIDRRFPLPNAADFDADGSGKLSPDEHTAFTRAEEQVRANRELAGIDGTMNSSVMDYASNWYERLQPLGRYDRAAIQFGYGDLVEAYGGAAGPDTPRVFFSNYQGGEACETDSDCPYSASGSRSAMLHARNREAQLTQRCVPATLPRAAPDGASSAKLCSSFDDDLASLAVPYEPLQYRFCTDDRADETLAWCNRFDEGSTYRDMVRNVTEDYERMYPFAAFRRYRKDFSVGSYRDSLIGRRFTILQNIYQNLLFQYTANPAFQQTTGDLGFYDQFLATTDILNFYARVLAQPNIGNYNFNRQTGTYVAANDTAPDLPIGFGPGRYYNTDYQAGLSGIERIDRVGSFFDKLWVLQLLTARLQQPTYTRDVAFNANFYDLFPNEMQQIFNGMIRAFPKAYMPRVVCDGGTSPCQTPRILYMDFYRGDCSNPDTCEPSPEVTYSEYPVLNGGGSLSLQIYAAVFGLQEFPVYFDTSFQNQLFVCVEGQGDCFAPGAAAVEGTDYVRHTSSRYRKSFLAFQVEPTEGVAEQTSIGFAMVKEARDISTLMGILARLQEAEGDVSALEEADREQLTALAYEPPESPPEIEAELARLDNQLQDAESFFNQIIDLTRDLGIQNFAVWQ
jgi:hypothetical protein